MVLAGEVKEFASARTEQKLIIKHMPGFVFLIDDSLYRRVQARFDNEIALWSADDGSHLMAIATFGMNAAGLAVIEEIALMVVSENWIPYESVHEKKLVDALASSRELSLKGLRYNFTVDLHGDVEPVDDVGCRLRHGAGQPLQDFGPVRDNRHIAKAVASDSFKCMESAIADCMLGGAAGDEITATRFAPPAAAASGHNEFEVSRRVPLGAANMSRIDADDEFLAPVPWKLHLELATVIRLRSRTPCFPHDLIGEPFAGPDGPLGTVT